MLEFIKNFFSTFWFNLRVAFVVPHPVGEDAAYLERIRKKAYRQGFSDGSNSF